MKAQCVIVGRGAIGAIYCNALSRCSEVSLRVVADAQRVEKYKQEPLIFNGRTLELNYQTPKDGDTSADLVIITTKWDGLPGALNLIEPIVSDKTLILPLLNGIMPYEYCQRRYGNQRVLRGFFIGTTAVRENNSVEQSGRYRTVIEHNEWIEKLFDTAEIKYRVEEDMVREQWQKLVINIGLNQTTAQRGGLSYGELRASEEDLELCRALMEEASRVASAVGIKRADELAPKAMELLLTLSSEDYSSMAQDVRAGRATECEIFGGYIIELAESLAVDVPYHRRFIEQNFSEQ